MTLQHFLYVWQGQTLTWDTMGKRGLSL